VPWDLRTALPSAFCSTSPVYMIRVAMGLPFFLFLIEQCQLLLVGAKPEQIAELGAAVILS